MKEKDSIVYIGTGSSYLKNGQICKVRKVINCPDCNDKILILYGYGFDDDYCHCKFCKSFIFGRGFSATAFKLKN